MNLTRHPTAQQLQAWLDTGDPPKLTRHIDECDRCMTAVEELSNLDDGLVAGLSAAFAVPDDVEDRAAEQVAGRLRDEAAFTAFIELFAIGWSTARTVLDANTPADPPSRTSKEDPHA